MIRFCDMEVNCVTLDGLTRGSLFSYFLQGNREALLCLIDESGKYLGNITYTSLLHSEDLEGSIRADKVILDKNIWENGRKFFCSYEKQADEIVLLPVVNKAGQLVCFAYEDEDANREIRQLRELTVQDKPYLGFTDVFPEYGCVTIWECNELAYYFAKYLQESGVPFNVKGGIWEVFGEWESHESLDYQMLDIYAEGTWERSNHLQESLQRSVSVEFECIDTIYEANIEQGWIKDSKGSLEEFLQRLQEKKEIYLLGMGTDSQDVYDFLLGNGIEISGFIADKEDKQNQQVLLGKPVYSRYRIPNPSACTLIECTQGHSAWGFGQTDSYDYAGYDRNERYFLMKDYKICLRSLLKHVLCGRNVVLTGDFLLCKKVAEYLGSIAHCKYWDIDGEGKLVDGCQALQAKEIGENDIVLVAVPQYFVNGNFSEEALKRKEGYITKIKELGVVNYTDYFCYEDNLLALEQGCVKKGWAQNLKGICIGAIQYFCGSIFFRGILEGHPQVLMMDSCYLSDNLFSICQRLSAEKKGSIVDSFWKIITEGLHVVSLQLENEFPDKSRFQQTLEAELEKRDLITSQDIFVILHLAYASMWHNIPGDLSETVIYWEPHFVPFASCEQYAGWLQTGHVPGYLINIARNGSIRAGSYLKFSEQGGRLHKLRMGHFWNMVDVMEPLTEAYDGYKRVIFKFEDLKCKPEEMLHKLCSSLEIEWSDTLLQTTCHGSIAEWRGTSGFDLRPVYDTYETYFTEYDRMRLMLLLDNWQSAYGYPRVDILSFSRKELQEMFYKDFRFEDAFQFWDDMDFRKYRLQRMKWMRGHIQKLVYGRKCGISWHRESRY